MRGWPLLVRLEFDCDTIIHPPRSICPLGEWPLLVLFEYGCDVTIHPQRSIRTLWGWPLCVRLDEIAILLSIHRGPYALWVDGHFLCDSNAIAILFSLPRGAYGLWGMATACTIRMRLRYCYPSSENHTPFGWIATSCVI